MSDAPGETQYPNVPEVETARPAAPRSAGGMAAAAMDEFSVKDAIGGPRGLIEATAPTLIFLVILTVRSDLRMAISASLGVAALAIIARLLARQQVTPAVWGAVGVGLAAVNASRTGQARDFFVPGLLINLGYALVLLISLFPWPSLTIAGTKHGPGSWPLIGVVLGFVTGEGTRWRSDPWRRRAMALATWLWCGLFTARLLVQTYLYLTDQIGLLGTAKLAMGLPLFGLAVYLTWVLQRAAPLSEETTDPEPQL